MTLLARELTDGLLSPTPSVPQLQCQEADSCPTGDKAGVHKDRPSKNIKTVTEEQEFMAPAMIKSELQCKLLFLKQNYLTWQNNFLTLFHSIDDTSD